MIRFGDPKLPSRFWDKIEVVPGGCWMWRGARTSTGYGNFMVIVDGVKRYVKPHRLAYERLVGPITQPHLDHLCVTPLCVYPGHLEPVTALENVRRSSGHGAENECPHGHVYSFTNTYIHRGKRFCRKCNARRMTKTRERLRQS